MQHLTTNKTTYKCGHYAVMPPYVTNDLQIKNYAIWAKGQGLCLRCFDERQAKQAHVHTSQNLYAELVAVSNRCNGHSGFASSDSRRLTWPRGHLPPMVRNLTTVSSFVSLTTNLLGAQRR